MELTAEDKAKEIVDRYLNTTIHFPYTDTEDGFCIGTGYITHGSAVKFALKEVDETIILLTEINNNESFNVSKYGNYYQEVKAEIEKL